MNYVGILAGGIGKRMGKTELPKQFLMVGNKPIIVHTIEQFLINSNIEKVIVAVPENWVDYTIDLVNKHIVNDKIVVIKGGADRNGTIMSICTYIKENYNINSDDIIITHDAVRPFITQRIINDNVEECIKFGATDTVIQATDTIVESKEDDIISNIPVRDYMYQGQTPQSFKILELMETYNNLTDEEKNILTDACKMYVMKDKKVKLVKGELYNMKITTPYDLKMANMMLGIKGEKDD
ncbi:MAG: 2-C-methyl-D-erythritol 4-phosphate cytidylyltransferase [Clostridia bacterium]|nr:2-C-methyl-D-erythritol 4-phosphate cytidylyltransferase [Clostridia bacterium]